MWFGYIGLTSNAQLDAEATFLIEKCSVSCDPDKTQVGSTSLYYSRTGNFRIEGSLTLAANLNLPAIDALVVDAEFTLEDTDLFDDMNPPTFEPNFKIEDLLKELAEGITLGDLTAVFGLLFDEFEPLTNEPAFNTKIPLVGKSITELLTGTDVAETSIADILDFSAFVNDFVNNTD